MKIRKGFVSNSSTSSFTCFGIPLNDTNKIEIFKKIVKYTNKGEKKEKNCNHSFNREKAKFCPTCGKESWNIINLDEEFDIPDYEDDLKKMGLEIIYGWLDDHEEEINFLGVDLEDNPMCGQEKLDKINKVNSVLSEMFPKNKKDVDFYSGTNYN
jgi:hypothetical protein